MWTELTSRLRWNAILIYLRNRDVPGVIGKVGTILGEDEINIADFSLGRAQRRRVDRAARGDRGRPRGRECTGRCADEAEKIPAVQQAKAVRLF